MNLDYTRQNSRDNLLWNLPIAKTVTSDSSIDVTEAVITNSSPSTSVIDFQTSLGWWQTVHQPHYQQIIQWYTTIHIGYTKTVRVKRVQLLIFLLGILLCHVLCHEWLAISLQFWTRTYHERNIVDILSRKPPIAYIILLKILNYYALRIEQNLFSHKIAELSHITVRMFPETVQSATEGGSGKLQHACSISTTLQIDKTTNIRPKCK